VSRIKFGEELGIENTPVGSFKEREITTYFSENHRNRVSTRDTILWRAKNIDNQVKTRQVAVFRVSTRERRCFASEGFGNQEKMRGRILFRVSTRKSELSARKKPESQ
jgi:hypothetical protein